MKPAKAELLAKVITWRVLSMTCGFLIAYAFTGKMRESAGITIVIGPTLMLVQWTFEVIWDRNVRERLRHVFSGQQGRIGRLVRWGREPRSLSMDEHKPGALDGEAGTNPLAPENAGREWT